MIGELSLHSLVVRNLPLALNGGIIAIMTSQNLQPTTLLLVRHGETAANVAGTWQGSTNTPLNERGLAQAHALASRLADEAPDIVAIYSSPLGRATQTAEIIAQKLGELPVQTDPALAEFNLGDWEGLTYEALRSEKRLWERMAEDFNFAPPNGESAVEFAMRLLNVFQTIAARHPGEKVAVVSHGGAIATALAMLIEQDGSRWGAYQMANCGLSELVFDPEPHLVRLNATEHLVTTGRLGDW